MPFYMTARGSLSELDTHTELCRVLDFLTADQTTNASIQLETAGALLNGLIPLKKGRTQ